MNTELGVPDDSDYTEEDYYKYNKEYYENPGSDAGGTYTLEAPENVKLGGEEYIYSYVKKLDDNLMCIIDILNSDTEKTPEFFEALFG